MGALDEERRTSASTVETTVASVEGQTCVGSLVSSDSEQLQAIARSIRDTAANEIRPDERGVISTIEKRRAQLVSAKGAIEVIDYGAGERESSRSEGEMKNGVRSVAFVSDVSRVSKSAFWCLFLFKLLRQIKPRSCLELGACVGISASYQAAALALNGEGRLLTLEGGASDR